MFKLTGVIKRNSAHLSFFLLFAGFFMTGITVGSVSGAFVNADVLEEFTAGVAYSAAMWKDNVTETVTNSGFSVCITLTVLWCTGFFRKKFCVFVASVIVVFKGIVTGYTEAMLIKAFGLRGVWVSAVSILPQYIVLMPLVFLAAMVAVHFSEMNFTPEKAKKYPVILLAFICGGIFCAFADGFVSGKLLTLFF